jgi:hypothetical protein
LQLCHGSGPSCSDFCELWQQQVLVLSSAAGNWDVIGEQLREHMDPQQTLLYASTANSR